MRTHLLAAALALAAPSRALPPCPSEWRLDFWTPAERWPDVDRVADPGLLHGMTRALYELCPREPANDDLLLAAAARFLSATGRDPDQAFSRQEVHLWAGLVHAHGAGDYDREDRSADAALRHFIGLEDAGLRDAARPHVEGLRRRAARKAAYIAYYTELNARNLGKPGWRGASQRLRCLLTAYPEAPADPENRPRLFRLLEVARDFISEHEGDARYDLSGMRALCAELQRALASPAATPGRWPTAADLDPAASEDPENCYRRPSPIPGPEAFDFDLTQEGEERRGRELRKARARVEAVMNETLP